MNHYDDLQRFKEKTRTHSLKFKDLSSEAAAGEKGDWVILNQLIPAEEVSSLAMGGSVSLPLPQRVPADMFHKVEPAAVQAPPGALFGCTVPDYPALRAAARPRDGHDCCGGRRACAAAKPGSGYARFPAGGFSGYCAAGTGQRPCSGSQASSGGRADDGGFCPSFCGQNRGAGSKR